MRLPVDQQVTDAGNLRHLLRDDVGGPGDAQNRYVMRSSRSGGTSAISREESVEEPEPSERSPALRVLSFLSVAGSAGGSQRFEARVEPTCAFAPRCGVFTGLVPAAPGRM